MKFTPMHRAIEKGHLDAVDALLSQGGADPNVPDEHGASGRGAFILPTRTKSRLSYTASYERQPGPRQAPAAASVNGIL
jgi:hypothetical protein